MLWVFYGRKHYFGPQEFAASETGVRGDEREQIDMPVDLSGS